MKKLLLLMAAAMLMTSCIVSGRDGKDGKDGKDGIGITRHIVDVPVHSNQWSYTNATDNNLYYAQVNLPELTQYAYDNGNVQVYMVSKDNNGKEIQTMLPSVRHYEYTNDGGLTYFSYTQTTDYDYWVGGMEFHITYSDFQYNPSDLNEPGDRTFRIVITY